jgi:hypothetical protein
MRENIKEKGKEERFFIAQNSRWLYSLILHLHAKRKMI